MQKRLLKGGDGSTEEDGEEDEAALLQKIEDGLDSELLQSIHKPRMRGDDG